MTESATRSRGRRNVVGNSRNRDVYVRLIQAGWTSEALERYAWFRWREDIPASTFRQYKRSKHIEVGADSLHTPGSEEQVDLLAERLRLISMQKVRLGIDFAHETRMNKLFGSNKAELDLLSRLLDAYKSDLQDLGLFSKVSDRIEIETARPEDVPAKRGALDEMVGSDPLLQAELAKVVHLASKRAAGASGDAAGASGGSGAAGGSGVTNGRSNGNGQHGVAGANRR